MNKVTYRNGVATISTRASTTDVHVPATACLVLQGDLDHPSKADVRALAIGFCTLETECSNLREELAAARAGKIGKEHAAEMQKARALLAALNWAGRQFFEMYDNGDAPDGEKDAALRNALNDGADWLSADSGAALARGELLREGQG